FEPLLALEQSLLPQVRSVLEHKIEDAVQKLRLVPQRVLQKLEMRDSVLSDRHEFAINHGVALDALECLGDLDVAVANDFAVAAVKCDFAAHDFRDHAKAVVLVL